MTARARALHLKHQEQHLQYKDPRPPPNSPPPSILSNFKCQWGPPRLVWSASPSGYDLSRYPQVMWWGGHFFFKVSFEKHPSVHTCPPHESILKGNLWWNTGCNSSVNSRSKKAEVYLPLSQIKFGVSWWNSTPITVELRLVHCCLCLSICRFACMHCIAHLIHHRIVLRVFLLHFFPHLL